MDETDFFPYHNRYCEFLLKDKSLIIGVVFESNLFPFNKFILVRSYNMIEFKSAQEIDDLDKCKTISEAFDISIIEEVKLLA